MAEVDGVVVVAEQPPDPEHDPEEAVAWAIARFHQLSRTESAFLAAFDGQDVAGAARAAGVGASAIRERRRLNPVFRLAEAAIRQGRRGLSSNLAKARLESAAARAAEELVALALNPADSARGVTAKITALSQLLALSGIVPPLRPTSAVTVNVGGDHRRLDTTAIDLWNERKARERAALESPATFDAAVDAPPAAQVLEVGDDGEPRSFPSEPSPYSPTPPPRPDPDEARRPRAAGRQREDDRRASAIDEERWIRFALDHGPDDPNVGSYPRPKYGW